MDDIRKRKLRLNTLFGVLNQIIVVICGLILPRLILLTYGSQINGLVNSITDILGVISLLELGMGTVVQSALYKPLADNDFIQINKIYNSAKKFFRIISYIFAVYIVILVIIYPLFFRADYDILFSALLIISISISMFAQYYFGIINSLLLQADQLNYIYFIIQIATTILNTALCWVEIKFGWSIIVIKLTTSMVYLFRPILLYAVVRKKYSFLSKIEVKENVLPQKWNGFAQHIAAFVLQNTDVLVLTFLSTLENVSIYSVYYLIAKSLVQLIVSYMSGYQSLMGNMIAKKEDKTFVSFFKNKELTIHIVTTLIFSIAAVLIVPFVLVYTKGVTDAQYEQRMFSILLLASHWLWCLRMFYYIPVKAVGDYKSTQRSAIIEAILNLTISICVVWKFGLCGVAIGTLVSIMYRTIYLIHYNYKYMFNGDSKDIIKLFCTDFCVALVTCALSQVISFSPNNYFEWFVCAFFETFIVCVIGVIVYGISYFRLVRAFASLKRKQ